MTKRDRIVLAVLGAGAVIAAFWMLVLAPKREEAASLKDQTAKEEQRRDDALARVRAGEVARESFADDYATLARLGKAVPVGDQTPSLLYQLESVARAQSVDLRTMKVRSSGVSGSTPASSSSTAKVTSATQAAAAVAPPGSAVGPAGFPTMPFTFKFEGDFFRMERLFSSIERFTSTIPSGDDVDVKGRLVTIDGFALVQSRIFGFPRVSATVNATAYLLPPGEGVVAGATADAPSGAGAEGETAAAPGSDTSVTATASAGGPLK